MNRQDQDRRQNIIRRASFHIYGSGPVGRTIGFVTIVQAGFLGALWGHAAVDLIYNNFGWSPPITAPLFFPPVDPQDTILTLIWYGVPMVLGLAICLAVEKDRNPRWRLTLLLGSFGSDIFSALLVTSATVSVILATLVVTTLLTSLAVTLDRHLSWARDSDNCPSRNPG